MKPNPRVIRKAQLPTIPRNSQPAGTSLINREILASGRGHGFALIVVLGTLALVTVLFLGLMSNASTELKSASAYEESAAARTLSDTATNLIITQLRNGTVGQSTTGGSPGAKVWASQPGMIRTYGSTGTPESFFKLYSDEAMVEAASSFTPDLDSLPSGWNTGFLKDIYTDINSPVASADGALVYPVLDPALSVGSAAMKGFSITTAPGYNSSASASANNNPAPMPVKWLYVLQDATVVAPQLNGSTIKIPGATETNPVVGRIAFWADDDTSKINVNTASEGTHWDVPRIYSLEDVGKFGGTFSTTNPQIDVPGYAICQPAQKEFQRYPGHPATTSLSTVFGTVPQLQVPDPATPIRTSADASNFELYYGIAPRTHIGGSQAGTKVSTSALQIEASRLYATFDELVLTPGRSQQTPLNAAIIDQRKFFLTSHSIAPETTLFNTPRISMWPVHLTASKRTAYDSLTAFCSTIGGKEFCITRSNARSGTEDLSPRNAALYAYLQALTSKNIPGFGGNFLTKYGPGPTGITDRDQLLTTIVDYIRCTNLQDRSQGATPFTPLFTGPGTSTFSGDVVPLKIGPTQGFGSFYSISQACIQFYGTFEDGSDLNRPERMRAVVILQPSSPLHGMACHRSGAKYRIKGLENFKVDFGSGEVSLRLPSDGTNFIERTDLASWHGRSVGGAEGINQVLAGKSYNDADSGAAARGKYPFFSAADIDIPSTGQGTFKFKGGGGEVVVEVRAQDTDELVQTVRLEFPDGEFKIPRTVGATAGVQTAHSYASREFPGWPWGIYGEDTVVGLQVAGSLAGGVDARDPDSTAGDSRMIGALRDVPAERFRAHPGYLTAGSQWGHSLAANTGHRYHGAQLGTLVPVANYDNRNIGRYPDVSPWVGSQVTRVNGGAGDWDTGFGDQKDGPHINKPDEGDTALYDNQGGKNRPPYILGYNQGFASATKEYFSPNRQIPSAMMLGSLPTGIQRNLPWQTLLFHSRPEDPTHPGRTSPPDHLLADLFWMPVVEPYAISQPFATAGKVNMNYQIQPFTYIKRDTGLRAVMKATKFLALQLSDVNVYKPLDPGNDYQVRAPDRRHAIDLDRTLDAFDAKFASGDLFRSATQICEIDLFPKGLTEPNMAAFWQNKRLTGDNIREKPYVDIYPRLTTKSNTFTVHIRTQTLKKARSTPADEWDPERDQIAAEYRGSNVVERYIDPKDSDLPDFAALMISDPNSPDLDIDNYYRVRVLNTNRFAP